MRRSRESIGGAASDLLVFIIIFQKINIPFGQRISRLEGREVYLPAVLYRPLGTPSIRILLALPPPQKTVVLISVAACSGERAGQKTKFHTYRKITVKSSGKTIK
jgi:hypothetical protein